MQNTFPPRRNKPKITLRWDADAPGRGASRTAPKDWGCEPGTPSYQRQEIAFAYASKRLLEEIDKTRRQRNR